MRTRIILSLIATSLVAILFVLRFFGDIATPAVATLQLFPYESATKWGLPMAISLPFWPCHVWDMIFIGPILFFAIGYFQKVRKDIMTLCNGKTDYLAIPWIILAAGLFSGTFGGYALITTAENMLGFALVIGAIFGLAFSHCETNKLKAIFKTTNISTIIYGIATVIIMLPSSLLLAISSAAIVMIIAGITIFLTSLIMVGVGSIMRLKKIA